MLYEGGHTNGDRTENRVPYRYTVYTDACGDRCVTVICTARFRAEADSTSTVRVVRSRFKLAGSTRNDSEWAALVFLSVPNTATLRIRWKKCSTRSRSESRVLIAVA